MIARVIARSHRRRARRRAHHEHEERPIAVSELHEVHRLGRDAHPGVLGAAHDADDTIRRCRAVAVVGIVEHLTEWRRGREKTSSRISH